MRFAPRTDFANSTSRYGEALRCVRNRDGFIDLTLSNPTRAVFDYSAFDLTALSATEVLQYNAHPLGMLHAREAVAALYAHADPQRILLTASTSEAYGYLLRLFCEPGSQVLVPSPSYPLFDLLARLHDVEVATYPLVYHDAWQIDPQSLFDAITPRTRAIVAIHPNNPTGHFYSTADRDALYAACEKQDLPLIVDEVFLEYGIEDAGTSFAQGDAPQLTFVLGGLSKLLAMPQMKLAWTVVCGPAAAVGASMERLEVIADTFLSAATPVQVAVPHWLLQRAGIKQQVLQRVRTNLASLDDAVAGTAITRLRVEGGWSAVLRLPAIEADETATVRLMDEERVALHPGSFYGFPDRGWMVVSLLLPTDEFREGIARLTRFVAA